MYIVHYVYNIQPQPQTTSIYATCDMRSSVSNILHRTPKTPKREQQGAGAVGLRFRLSSASSCTVPFAYMYNIMACGMGAYSVSSEQIPESENLPWAVTVAVGYILYSIGHTHMQHATTWCTGCSHCLIGDWIRCNRSSSCDCNCGCGAGGRGRGKWSSG